MLDIQSLSERAIVPAMVARQPQPRKKQVSMVTFQQNFIYKCGNLIFLYKLPVPENTILLFVSFLNGLKLITLSWRATQTFGMAGVADQGTVGQPGKEDLHLLGGSRAADRPRIHGQRQGSYTNSLI